MTLEQNFPCSPWRRYGEAGFLHEAHGDDHVGANSQTAAQGGPLTTGDGCVQKEDIACGDGCVQKEDVACGDPTSEHTPGGTTAMKRSPCRSRLCGGPVTTTQAVCS